MKKLVSLILIAVLCLTVFSGCGSKTDFTVGVCQLMEHESLDKATNGFKDALTAELQKAGKTVTIDVQVAGEPDLCTTVINAFNSKKVDLIMANATPALAAAATATKQIPILGTSVTDYGSALAIDNWTGTTGTNISGTSDLAPLDGQAAMLNELFPDAKNIGLLYCSGEPNSKFQADTIAPLLEEMGYNVTAYTFADSNDVAAVTQNACDDVDVIYIPTDNTAASCAEAINNVAIVAGVPIIAGEEGICSGCGVATLSISYFDLGYATGEMAAEILVDGADVSSMEIRYAPTFTKKFNSINCETLGIEVPADYVAIGE